MHFYGTYYKSYSLNLVNNFKLILLSHTQSDTALTGGYLLFLLLIKRGRP